MKLEKWALIAEIVGGIAIVVSLVFVGFEVRQNSLRQIQATTQTVISTYSAQLNMLSQDANLACLYIRGARDISELGALEIAQLSGWFLATNRILEDIYFQQEQGSIQPEIWAAIEGSLRLYVAPYPGFRQWVAGNADSLTDNYRQYLMQLFEQVELAEPSNAVASSC